MDINLHKKYEHVTYDKNVISMLVDIIKGDEATRKVLKYITKKTYKSDQVGISVKQITEEVTLNRKVKDKKAKKFIFENTNIDRKTAERIVDKLLFMGLCYYQPVLPTKLIYISQRGKQVSYILTQGDDNNDVQE